MFAADPVAPPGVNLLILLPPPWLASTHVVLVAPVEDSLVAAVGQLLTAAVGLWDPSTLFFAVGSWLAPRPPTVDLSAAADPRSPAEVAAEPEGAAGTDGHPAAFPAIPAAESPKESFQQPEPGGACPGAQCGVGCSDGEDVGASHHPVPSNASVLESLPGVGSAGLSPQQLGVALAAGPVQTWKPVPG